MFVLFAVPILLLAGFGTAQTTPSDQAIRAVGAIELSPVEALRSGEQRAIEIIWDKFGDVWQSQTRLVPATRLEQDLTHWLRRDFTKLQVAQAEPVEIRDTTAGSAYRQGFAMRLDGPEARHLQLRGSAIVAKLNRRFRQRYAVIGALWVLLLLGSLRIDRATRGYLTGRIRFASLALAILATVLIYP